MPNTIRLECYAAIRKAMKDRVMAYYRQHPDIFGDARSQRAIEESMSGLQSILDVLDQYDIRRKGDK